MCGVCLHVCVVCVFAWVHQTDIKQTIQISNKQPNSPNMMKMLLAILFIAILFPSQFASLAMPIESDGHGEPGNFLKKASGAKAGHHRVRRMMTPYFPKLVKLCRRFKLRKVKKTMCVVVDAHHMANRQRRTGNMN